MKRVEAYRILHNMWKEASEKEKEAIEIAQNDIEFVDLMPNEILSRFSRDKTNADRFRRMSDEEQQRFVRRFWEVEDFADWLKQPYKDEKEC